MKHKLRRIAPAVAMLALAGARCLAADSTPAAAAPEAAVWQQHHESFTYEGFTARYTCDGIEGKVASILSYFGARKDMQIKASGCPRGPETLSRTIWVTADFYTLGTAAADSPPGALVQSQWTPFKLNGQYPFFMGPGDCELIDSMRALLTHNFRLRNLDYDVSCTPYQETFVDFWFKGEVLKSSAKATSTG